MYVRNKTVLMSRLEASRSGFPLRRNIQTYGQGTVNLKRVRIQYMYTFSESPSKTLQVKTHGIR